MHFSNECLTKLESERSRIRQKYLKLAEGFLTRTYKNPQAKEYACHGFSRRLRTLARCIDNVFEILPPDRIDPPSSEEISDAMINIQASVFNTSGCVDDLAWIWVIEKPVLKDNGLPLSKFDVGLRKCNTVVRGSLSTKFQQCLEGLESWFTLLDNFRDALAHRIPLYIPPYVVPTSKETKYRELQDLIIEAERQKDFVKAKELRDKQHALVTFKPIITHSFEERAEPIFFHPQLLANFLTIEELGKKMLKELDP